jgi:hypothetical protein
MWEVTIKTDCLGGSTFVAKHKIKARTERSALSKAYAIIGDRSGEIVEIKKIG